eukprot:6468882-Amphidinium_carterae.1
MQDDSISLAGTVVSLGPEIRITEMPIVYPFTAPFSQVMRLIRIGKLVKSNGFAVWLVCLASLERLMIEVVTQRMPYGNRRCVGV